MTKYKEYFDKMLRENKEVFDSFAKLHFEYSMDEDGLQEEFNLEGEKVMDIVRDYEDKLCRNTERGVYNKFSSGLAEKFQELVRSHFPLIDHVGLIVTKPAPKAEEISEEPFNLKKINHNTNTDTSSSFAAADSFNLRKINL